jgi:hypothetical protein
VDGLELIRGQDFHGRVGVEDLLWRQLWNLISPEAPAAAPLPSPLRFHAHPHLWLSPIVVKMVRPSSAESAPGLMVTFHLVKRQIRACAALTAVVVAVAGGVFCSEPVLGESAVAARTTVIFVARRDWHIDIGFAAADLEAPLDASIGQFPGVRYVFFGFGDRHYLMAKSRNVPAMLGALWPGPGLMLITGLIAAPSEAFGADQVIELRVSDAQARGVQGFIARSMARSDSPVGGDPPANSARVTPDAPGPYEGSLYFAAISRYSALHTCNTWAAEALQAGGLPVRSSAVLFAGQLWRQVRKVAAAKAGNEPLALRPVEMRPGGPVGIPAPAN